MLIIVYVCFSGNVRQISNESSDSTSSQRRMSSSSSCESSGDKVRICGRRVSATELFTNVILQPADVFEHHRLSLIGIYQHKYLAFTLVLVFFFQKKVALHQSLTIDIVGCQCRRPVYATIIFMNSKYFFIIFLKRFCW